MNKYLTRLLICAVCALHGSDSDAAFEAALAAATGSNAAAGVAAAADSAVAGASNVGYGGYWLPTAAALATGAGGLYYYSRRAKKPRIVNEEVSLDLRGYEQAATLLGDFANSQDPNAALTFSWAYKQPGRVWGERPGEWKSRTLNASDVYTILMEYKAMADRYSFMEYLFYRLTVPGELKYGSNATIARVLPAYVKFEFSFIPSATHGVHGFAGVEPRHRQGAPVRQERSSESTPRFTMDR